MKTHVFTLRLTEEEREALNQAAARAGEAPATWARLVLMVAAGKSDLHKQLTRLKR